MRWRYSDGVFYPGFDPDDFVVVPADQGPDEEGVRTIDIHYQKEADVLLFPLAIDPDGVTCDVFVVTNTEFLGLLEMSLSTGGGFVAVTDDPQTSFIFRNLGGNTLNVAVRLTVPTGDPVDIPLHLLWDKPQT